MLVSKELRKVRDSPPLNGYNGLGLASDSHLNQGRHVGPRKTTETEGSQNSPLVNDFPQQTVSVLNLLTSH